MAVFPQAPACAPAPGYIFYPTDEEILDSFLKKKLQHLPLPSDMIKEANVYGTHPNNLTAQFVTANKFFQWFFFTWTIKKHPDAEGSTKASRVAGQGRWKSTQNIKQIRNSNGQVIGSRQNFCYMERTAQGKEDKTMWLMEEYSIHSLRTRGGVATSKDQTKLDDWVVCKIYLRPKARKEPSSMKVSTMEMTNLERLEIGNQHFIAPIQDSLNFEVPDNTLPHLIDASGQEMVSFGAPRMLHDGVYQHPPSRNMDDNFGSLYHKQLASIPDECLDYAPQYDMASLPDISCPLNHEQLITPAQDSLNSRVANGTLPHLIDAFDREMVPFRAPPMLHDGELLYPTTQDIDDDFGSLFYEQLAGSPNHEGFDYAPEHDMASLPEIPHPFNQEQLVGVPNEGLHYTPQHDMSSLHEILHPFYDEQPVGALDESLDCAPTCSQQLDLASLPEILTSPDLSFSSIDEILKEFDDVPDEKPPASIEEHDITSPSLSWLLD